MSGSSDLELSPHQSNEVMLTCQLHQVRSKESGVSAQLTHCLGHHPCRHILGTVTRQPGHPGRPTWVLWLNLVSRESCHSSHQETEPISPPLESGPALWLTRWLLWLWLWYQVRPSGGWGLLLPLGIKLQCGESSCLGTMSLGGSLSWPSGQTEVERRRSALRHPKRHSWFCRCEE